MKYRCTQPAMRIVSLLLGLLVVVILPGPLFADTDGEKAIDTIIAGIEARYNVPGFSAEFDQQSILKAMEVTDTAAGRLFVRQPGKMRWEYLVPEPQTIISDGKDLWVYRPEEHQVMVGKAPAFFGDGKGAGFLSNIKSVRKSFALTLIPSDDPELYRIQMLPNHSSADLMEVHLDIARKNFDLRRIITFNVYGDETRIDLKNVNFTDTPPESLFRFEVPEGTDVLQMNE
jgi:outer membrane lipoprotein carrier protein